MFIQKYPKILFSFRRKWLYVAWALALFVMVGENCESQTIYHTVMCPVQKEAMLMMEGASVIP